MIEMGRVLHVPQLRSNLLSCLYLTCCSGFKIVIDSTFMHFMRDEKLCFRARPLPMLPTSMLPPSLLQNRLTSSQLAHLTYSSGMNASVTTTRLTSRSSFPVKWPLASRSRRLRSAIRFASRVWLARCILRHSLPLAIVLLLLSTSSTPICLALCRCPPQKAIATG